MKTFFKALFFTSGLLLLNGCAETYPNPFYQQPSAYPRYRNQQSLYGDPNNQAYIYGQQGNDDDDDNRRVYRSNPSYGYNNNAPYGLQKKTHKNNKKHKFEHKHHGHDDD